MKRLFLAALVALLALSSVAVPAYAQRGHRHGPHCDYGRAHGGDHGPDRRRGNVDIDLNILLGDSRRGSNRSYNGRGSYERRNPCDYGYHPHYEWDGRIRCHRGRH